MIRPGIVSVTFRSLTAADVIKWTARAGLDGIEWGADVHVPPMPGGGAAAREIGLRTREAGLENFSYGSYYRVGHTDPGLFGPVLETALALGAPVIRVWPGGKGSADADDGYRERVAADARRIVKSAGEAGICIACEWHAGTLTDTAASATALFEAVGQPETFRAYWQARRHMTLAESLADIDAALPRMIGLHVLHSDEASGERRPLRQGETFWRACLARAATAADCRFALLEFVKADDPRQMREDAAALCEWLSSLPKEEPQI